MTKDVTEDLPDRTAAKTFYRSYEPKEILGRGISSTVRRCTEKSTGKEYAVKIIDISGQSPEASQIEESTLKEINLLRMISGHKYIIELHDAFFELPTFIFLIFELCNSGELFDYLTRVVTLSEKKTRIIMRQLLEAVAFIHNKNIVHRDLKPENILLDDAGNVKLTDFGFATILEENETLSDLCGTPGYLSPEVLRASMYENAPGYGKEIDMWACGVIMYTLLVGCPPFWHRKQMVMLRSIMEGKYHFGPEWDDISDPPKDVIRKLLLVDPSKRLTAKEALEHPFFHIQQLDLVKEVSTITEQLATKKAIQPIAFDSKRMWRVGIICVKAYLRIQRLHLMPRPISSQTARDDPYKIKIMRKIIDGCAFGIYGHWVKRGEGQNRAALFEGTPKYDLMQAIKDKEVEEVDAFSWSKFY